MNSGFRAAVRSMLLPIAPALEQDFVIFCDMHLDAINVLPEDRTAWIEVELRSWRSIGIPSINLRRLVKRALYESGRAPASFMFDLQDLNSETWPGIARQTASSYFALHESIRDSHLLNHDEARQILSHAGLIVRLAEQERMTASEISRLVSVRDARFRNNWRVISLILSRLGIQPQITEERFQGTFENDAASEALVYGDATIEESIELVSTLAVSLGCPGDFDGWLNDVLIKDYHAPYLLILHFQLISLAHYDHAPTYAYEFSPRGINAIWLTERYSDYGIPVAQSAFLNNAKATLRFDGSWVAGRTDHLRSATALSAILQQIESLGYVAKLEIASHIRSLLSRFIRVQRNSLGALPSALPDFSDAMIAALINSVGGGNSGTAGILEQRLIDCVAAIARPTVDGWHGKGVGDSVFAANLPRRKIGDCEFMRVSNGSLEIFAYEAHGGQLSLPYVKDHLSTLDKVLALRHGEFAMYGDVGSWTIVVTFIAHSFEVGLLNQHFVKLESGLAAVEIRYQLFTDALEALASNNNRVEIVSELLRIPLNLPFIHPQIRSKTIALLDGQILS